MEATGFLDGNVFKATVTNGKVTFPQFANIATVGLSYSSVLSPMPLEVNIKGASSVGKTKKVSKISVKLIESMGGKIGCDIDKLEPLIFLKSNNTMDKPPELFSGVKTVPYTGEYSYSITPLIVQDDPFPMSIIAIYYDMGIYGS